MIGITKMNTYIINWEIHNIRGKSCFPNDILFILRVGIKLNIKLRKEDLIKKLLFYAWLKILLNKLQFMHSFAT